MADGEPLMKATPKAARACATIVALARAAEALEHWPTQVEYGDYWRIDERTVQREWAAFRRAFPTEESPDRLARWLRAEVTGRLDRRSPQVFSLPVPAELLPTAA